MHAKSISMILIVAVILITTYNRSTLMVLRLAGLEVEGCGWSEGSGSQQLVFTSPADKKRLVG